MTDFVLKAPSREVMEQGMAAVGMMDSEGNVRDAGRFTATGTDWAAFFPDTVHHPTGNTVQDGEGNDIPEYAPLPGSYLYVRTNGTEDVTPLLAAVEPLGIEVYWSSDGEDPLPDWFPRIG
ncbi:MAG: hypothetical protein AB7F96_16540 [Beijerinckiaceae bacterium]